MSRPESRVVRWSCRFGFVIALGAGVGAAVGAVQPERYDLAITGGWVVDGAGGPRFRADVGVRDGRIVRVGRLGGATGGFTATVTVDAGGHIVAPGFIDPHTHSLPALLTTPTADSLVRQGITTVVDGNDGSSPLPLRTLFDRVAALHVSPNFAMFVGHGSVRATVMKTENRAPTPAELEQMRTLVGTAMADGALGLSTGLAYVPGNYASTDEVVELARVVANAGGLYVSHMRDEGGGVLESVRETIRVGEGARIPVHISHHKVGGAQQFGQSADSLLLMKAARDRGVDVTFDQYPYTASSTGLSLMFPTWALADDRLAARLADPSQAPKVKAGVDRFIAERFAGDPAKVQIVRCGFNRALAGKTIAELLDAAGRPQNAEAFREMVVSLQLEGGCSAIFHAYAEPDVERFMQSDLGMIGSDGSLVALVRDAQGELAPTGESSPHPRAYGTYPRVLGRYVRERGILSLEQAVRKMTSLPAARLGFQDRGLVREGLAADLVVFDASRIIDTATFTDPHRYPEGIDAVIVNGDVVVDHGRHTGATPGRVLYGPGRAR